MAFADELQQYAHTVFVSQWTHRQGESVPETDDIPLRNDGVNLDATVLYADLADSTGLVLSHTAEFAAEVYKAYLYVAAKIIGRNGGSITAYDGDRIMAVYLGGTKNTNAAKTALQIHWAVNHVIQPALRSVYTGTDFTLEQKVGIDTSSVMVAKTGVRGHNDLVWVGTAANRAAKLAALSTSYAAYISDDVFSAMLDSAKYGGDPAQLMWTDLGWNYNLGTRVYGSNWTWAV